MIRAVSTALLAALLAVAGCSRENGENAPSRSGDRQADAATAAQGHRDSHDHRRHGGGVHRHDHREDHAGHGQADHQDGAHDHGGHEQAGHGQNGHRHDRHDTQSQAHPREGRQVAAPPGKRSAGPAETPPASGTRQPQGTGHNHDHHHNGDRSQGGDHDHEGESRHTRIPAAMAARVGLRSEPVASGTLRDEHYMQGLLVPVDGKVARVVARFPGPVRAVHVNVGDRVRAGQRLASVESNLSLSRYDVPAPIGGTILARQVTVGDLAGEQVLFEIADLDELWVDLHLFGADADRVEIGMPVRIERLSDGARAESQLERVLPGTATASQSTVARARMANSDGRWRPGTAVRAAVTVSERIADLVVPLAALQRMDNEDVVFVQDGDEYEARVVSLGARDGLHAEVLDGVKAGERVVVAQSFLVKADIEKSGAAHEH